MISGFFSMAPISLALILFAVSLNTAAQILIKKGMLTIGHFDFTFGNVVPIFFKIIQNSFLLGGISLYVFSLGAWLLTLSRVDVSVAYPMTSLGYIFTAFMGYCYLQETLSPTRIIGIIIIMIGVILVTRST